MPQKIIDYSNTTIYKIVCNDETTEYIYVGHTTNLVKIKCQHKSYTENPKFNSILYKTIREHGGWSNWTIYQNQRKSEVRIFVVVVVYGSSPCC